MDDATISLRKREVGLDYASLECGLRVSAGFTGLQQVAPQALKVIQAAVRQNGFENAPHPFVWIYVWRGAEESFRSEPPGTATWRTVDCSSVGPAAASGNHDGSPEVPEGVARERPRLCLLDVLEVPREVEAEVLVPWANRVPGDDQEIVALGPVRLHPELLRHDCNGCCVLRRSVQYP